MRGLIVPVKNAQWLPFSHHDRASACSPGAAEPRRCHCKLAKRRQRERGGSRNNHSNYYSVAGSLISTGYLKGLSSANLRAET